MLKEIAILFLGGWLLAGCAGHVVSPVPYRVRGMDNGVRIGDLLFGGQPSEAALAQLAAEGYKTVLSTRGEDETGWDEEAKVRELGMTFISIPMPHPLTAITDEHVKLFTDAMKIAKRPIVVHCGSGDRAAGLWAVWLAEHEKIPPKEAIRLGVIAGIKKVRPLVEERLGLRESAN